MNRLILYALFTPLLMPAVFADSASVKPETVVAHFGDVPIYAEEFALHVRGQVALVAVHFKTRHQVDLSGQNWMQAYEDEIPLELLKERSLASCRRAKAIQLLALQYGLAEKLPFPGFAAACERINLARARGRAEGRVLYGPLEYSAAQLYKYKLTNMQNHLGAFLAKGNRRQRDALLEAAIREQLKGMTVILQKEGLNQLVIQQIGGS